MATFPVDPHLLLFLWDDDETEMDMDVKLHFSTLETIFLVLDIPPIIVVVRFLLILIINTNTFTNLIFKIL